MVDEVAVLTGTTGMYGFDDGPGGSGLFTYPTGVTSDGTHLYIIEDYMDTLDGYIGNRVRSLDMATGIISLVTGGGDATCQDGVGKQVRFNGPQDIVVDRSHGALYVADACGIRKVVIATGEVTTFTKAASRDGGSVTDGLALWSATALALDSNGTRLYVSDPQSHQIRVFDLSTSAMTTLAGSVTQGSADGVGSAATLCGPASLALDPADTKLYFADSCENDLIRVVDIPSREVTTIVGVADKLNGDDGVGRGAGFFSLGHLAVDATGTSLYASEGSGTRHMIRRVELASRVVTTIAGSKRESGSTDAIGTDARFSYPVGLVVVDNSLYVADSNNLEIRKIALDTMQVSTYAGSNKPATFHDPVNVATDGTYLYVVDKDNNAIRKVSMASGYTTTLVGSGLFGHADGVGTAASFHFPSGIAIAGSQLFVADTSNHEIRAVDLTNNQVTTLAGSFDNKGATDGVGASASFNLPQGLVADPSGRDLYVTDQFNHEIRKIVIATGQVTTFAGSTESGFTDGMGSAARFNMPANIAVDPAGTSLYVTDASNNAVRKIDIASAKVTTVAGDTTAGNKDGIGKNARFDTPWGIVTDGTNAYVSDAANGIIRKIELASSTVSVQCGRRLFEYEDGTCAKALFNAPAGLSLDATGSTLYVCDSINNQIRAVRLK